MKKNTMFKCSLIFVGAAFLLCPIWIILTNIKISLPYIAYFQILVTYIAAILAWSVGNKLAKIEEDKLNPSISLKLGNPYRCPSQDELYKESIWALDLSLLIHNTTKKPLSIRSLTINKPINSKEIIGIDSQKKGKSIYIPVKKLLSPNEEHRIDSVLIFSFTSNEEMVSIDIDSNLNSKTSFDFYIYKPIE